MAKEKKHDTDIDLLHYVPLLIDAYGNDVDKWSIANFLRFIAEPDLTEEEYDQLTDDLEEAIQEHKASETFIKTLEKVQKSIDNFENRIKYTYQDHLQYPNTRVERVIFSEDGKNLIESGNTSTNDIDFEGGAEPVRIDEAGNVTVDLALKTTSGEIPTFYADGLTTVEAKNYAKTIAGIVFSRYNDLSKPFPEDIVFDPIMLNYYQAPKKKKSSDNWNKGVKDITKEKKLEIINIVNSLEDIFTYIDYTDHINNGDIHVVKSRMFNLETHLYEVGGQQKIMWRVTSCPPIVKYALECGQIGTKDLKIVLPRRASTGCIAIDWELTINIDLWKNKGLDHGEISYNTLFSSCGLGHLKAKSQIKYKNFITEELLPHWQKAGYIKGFEEYPTKNGKTHQQRGKIRIDFEPKKKQIRKKTAKK